LPELGPSRIYHAEVDVHDAAVYDARMPMGVVRQEHVIAEPVSWQL
jgi:hypothetical protein